MRAALHSAALIGAALLGVAMGLAGCTSGEETTKALDLRWSAYAEVLPRDIATLQARIASLSLPENQRAAAAVDVAAARASLSSAASLWSKARAAFAAGNLAEAVDTAKGSEVKIAISAAALKIDLPAAAMPNAG